MHLKVKESKVEGEIFVPGSKSHTIRALYFAAMSNGTSVIKKPLLSEDTKSATNVLRHFGADIKNENGEIIVKGFGNKPKTPEDVVDVGNSGTTLRLGLMTAALCEGITVFTGDYQIRRRPLGPLIKAIGMLGGECYSTRNNDMSPVVVKGIANGGEASIDAYTSQFLSSILINAPLFKNDTKIMVERLNEVPYAEMTLWWLDKHKIKYTNNDFKNIEIKGGQSYNPMDVTVPGDFSSATFFMVLSAIQGTKIKMNNLDITDTQGDKRVLKIIEEMGAQVTTGECDVIVKGESLKGIDVDMNSIPDALPAMAVLGCFAKGETKLLNVPQARMKETDRIHVMCTELKKMGADIEELPDGLIIRESKLMGTNLCGHDDHRIVMALSIAGLCSVGETIIDTAEAMKVTFPEYADFVKNCGGNIQLIEED